MTCPNADREVSELTDAEAEAAVLCLINQERANVGARPLVLNLTLRKVAREHANAAVRIKWWPENGGSVIHTNPETGLNEQQRIHGSGYCPADHNTPANENGFAAFYNGAPSGISPQDAVTWWMGSPGHRTTLLNPIYTETGIGIVLGSPTSTGPWATADGAATFVQDFGGCPEPLPAVDTDVWTWGFNDDGQLGDGDTANRPSPVRPTGRPTDVAAIAAWGHSLIAKNDGSVWAWGRNPDGQLGDGTDDDREDPVRVDDVDGVVQVAAGFAHSVALRGDGTVWTWGGNLYGGLGLGAGVPQATTPRQVPIGGITAVAAGFYHTLALDQHGVIWGWGANVEGQLGNGTTTAPNGGVFTPQRARWTSRFAPVTIAAGTGHGLALDESSQVWAWGGADSGQLGIGIGAGDGTTPPVLEPVKVAFDGGIQIVDLAAGVEHSLALDSDGHLWAWGDNQSGTLGDGTTDRSTVPKRIGGNQRFTAVKAGAFHSLAIRTDGTLWAWGYNKFGGLGIGSMSEHELTPQRSTMNRVVLVAGGHYHTIAAGSGPE